MYLFSFFYSNQQSTYLYKLFAMDLPILNFITNIVLNNKKINNSGLIFATCFDLESNLRHK